jgi:hypothetical protein
MREEQVRQAGQMLVQAAARLRTTRAKTVEELKRELAQVAGDIQEAGEALTNALGMS